MLLRNYSEIVQIVGRQNERSVHVKGSDPEKD